MIINSEIKKMLRIGVVLSHKSVILSCKSLSILFIGPIFMENACLRSCILGKRLYLWAYDLTKTVILKKRP